MKTSTVYLSFCVLLVYIGLVSGIVRADLTNGLAAYYPFDGNANDLSAYANHGTVYGASLTTDRFGAVSSAYEFDGTDDYINVPHSPSLDITGTVSISAWVKTSDNYWRTGIVNKLPGHMPDIGYSLRGAEGQANFGVYRAVGGNHRGASAYSQTNIEDGKWHHLVGTFDGTAVQIYVDGSRETSTPYDLGFDSNTTDLLIGKYYYPYNDGHGGLHNQVFNGAIDDVRIYNRALSASEVQALAAPRRSKLYGLSIGTNDGVLKRGDRDATSVFDALSRFPQWANAADGNTSAAITLTATSTDVESSIESSLNAMDVRDGDWLIFYVSAHGGTPTRTGDETPVTIDGAENSADELIQLGSSLISDDDLTNLFDNEKWQNVNKLFLISACHSGGFVGDDLTSDTGDLENLDHVAVLASSTEEGTSFYRDTTGQCIWTTDALLPNLTSGMTVADLVASMAAAEEGIRAAYIGQEFGLSDMYAPGSTGVFEYQPLNHVSDDIPLNVALPEPATLTFLTLGGLAILRRRRKR